MKLKLIFTGLLFTLFLSFNANAQYEEYVQTEVISYYPPVGPYNYFGYNLKNISSNSILVEGYITGENDPINSPRSYFSVYLSPGQVETADIQTLVINDPTSSAIIVITNLTVY